MPRKANETFGKPTETEKITVNLGPVDLGQIDLLVEEGFYSNRTDLIRTAIRSQLSRHDDALRKSVERRSLDLGLRRFSRRDLEEVVEAGERLTIEVLGLCIIEPDVDAQLARKAIASLTVLGALQAPADVKTALKDRIG